ncbi:hypothetical protein [Falsiroseomonas sp. CW058]|uniref:hypothetical protein n=1 Tax=Falsiroseomonas sp. CW058 TaxID=3388664 RepID=UPI003D31A488
MEPLSHGPFLVEPDGRLAALRPPALRFAWRGHGVEARVEGGRMRLTAQAGALPYTVEGAPGRAAAIAEVGRLPGDLPQGWRLRVLPDHRLRLEAAMEMPGLTTATALIGAMVGFALTLDPYLDRLELAGVAAG